MPPQPMMMPIPEFSAQTLIAGVSAVMQAIQTWLAYRSLRQSSQKFDVAEIAARRSEEVAREADIIQNLVPPDILESLTKRAKKCWTKYKKILDSEGEYLPDDVDEATKAVKSCICRELKRIKELNVFLPDGILRKWWNEYCTQL